jgi:hypothetical protein
MVDVLLILIDFFGSITLAVVGVGIVWGGACWLVGKCLKGAKP